LPERRSNKLKKHKNHWSISERTRNAASLSERDNVRKVVIGGASNKKIKNKTTTAIGY